MNKTIRFIRHGESAANAGLATVSPETIPLTGAGREQAKTAARYFTEPPALIVISPYLRTSQTAEPLIDKFPFVAVENWPVQEFTYLDPERCRNSTFEQRKPLVAEYWQRRDAFYRDGQGAESFADFFGRARATLEKIRSLKVETAAIFTHGQFIRAMMWMLLTCETGIEKTTMESFYNFLEAITIPNAGIIEAVFTDSKTYLSNIICETHLRPEQGL